MSDLQQVFADSDLPFRVDTVDWAVISAEFHELIRNTHVKPKHAARGAATSTAE